METMEMLEKPKKTEKKTVHLKKKQRIPVSKIYWKKGTYKELVDDPFNLAI